MLTVLSILSGLAAPAVNDYVEQAKMVKAQHDVKTLGVTLVRLFDDVGAAGAANGPATYDLLVGAGTAPLVAHPEGESWAADVAAEGVGLLDDHLVTNAAGYPASTGMFERGWRGAYLQDPVSVDPWGTRYAVNVANMRHPSNDTIVLSAGPDGRVETPFAADGVGTRGDDVTAVIASAGSPR